MTESHDFDSKGFLDRAQERLRQASECFQQEIWPASKFTQDELNAVDAGFWRIHLELRELGLMSAKYQDHYWPHTMQSCIERISAVHKIVYEKLPNGDAAPVIKGIWCDLYDTIA